MFRRRTDQVYSTLQQVQRRITEQGAPTRAAPPAPAVRPLVSLPGARPAEAPSFPPPARPATSRATTPAPGAPPPPVQPGPGLNLGGPPSPTLPIITLTLPQVITLVIVLIVSHTVVWFVASRRVEVAAADAVQTQRPAENAIPTEMQGQRHIILLAGVPTSERASVDMLKRNCEKLNEWLKDALRRSGSPGGKSWFHVRDHTNGDTQLIFGYGDGRFGVEKAKWELLFRNLTTGIQGKPALYPKATWLPVN